MMLSLLILVAAAGSRHCDIKVGELVPTEEVARDLADVIFRSRETPERHARYVIHVQKDDEDGWIVFQDLPDPPPDDPDSGYVTVKGLGYGLGMRINRCNGAMSEVFYQR